MSQENIDEVVEILESITEDDGVPKKVKEKLRSLIHTLKDNSEPSMKINKCLAELDQIADDVNLQTFIRTQVWNASSILEKVDA